MFLKNKLYYTIFWVLVITCVEATAMSIIEYSANNSNNYYILGMICYMFVPIILYRLLLKGELSVINSLWNVSSIVIVTIIGITVFKDKITKYKLIGVLFSILAIASIEYEQIEKFMKS